ncbi:sushi, von Willebrand factor type A, EGF and pentraxin domain-containing protein 1-like [Uloborus diversus]|uniref:sushi, von Willebrand factor type A, EGF and pentraxin domain-containing protein 1-like n=1 Tax=Uloborus diversus TaxID=327109 RepID=UPI00240A6554|nr:sushi, von Willebrand factor type A, EGF and pentraxin domain-containing protein 1-like [Uloborus diversus]
MILFKHMEVFSVIIYAVIFVHHAASLSANAVCNELPSIENGRLILNGRKAPFNSGDIVEFSCDQTYESDRRNPRFTCTVENGLAHWTNDSYCKLKVISCNDPGFIENADRLGFVFTYPHNITYVCNEGYKMNGRATKICMANGLWHPSNMPTCEEIVCPLLTDPPNGKVISSQKKLHSVATYQCARNFKLKGSAERVCLLDGTWSGSMPTCEEIYCADPGPFDNIQVLPQQQKFKAGEIVIFKCIIGTTRASSKCSDNGEWTSRPPICPEVKKTESTIITAATTPETITEVKRTDSSLISTTPDVFTDASIEKKVSCEDPGKIKNGDRTFVTLNINSTLTYQCDEGYELKGKSILLCLENGKWDLDTLPYCKKIMDTPTIIGIVFGIIALIALVIAGWFFYRWREKRLRGYGEKSKALTADAADLEEITGLEKGKKPVPVTVL